ncbi:hypothetical protein EV714DRAFT_221153 [Schizophyllum commune]
MTTRKPYEGKSRRLVIAIDVGTTFSGVSYSVLDPGQVPQVCGVNRFPAQEHAGGDSKIPSVLLYDTQGVMRAAGAETLQEDIIEAAIEEGWSRAEWCVMFKLHLRPRELGSDQALATLPPLPPNKSVVDIFADFLAYLFTCARTYIQETHPGGVRFWTSIAHNIDFVLTHPNGWEGYQQAQMREAAVQAGLVADTDEGKARVSFVTEGEASLHFCLNKGLIVEGMKDGKGVIIVDAGGGTVDLSAYAQVKTGANISYTEVAPAQCLFKGSIMVKRNAQAYIEGRLRNSKFSDRSGDIVDAFDKSTKLTFKSAKTSAYVKFGGMNDVDTAYDVRGGKLVIPGAEVAKFFQPTVTAISQAVLRQRTQAKPNVSSVFLVGGFAASPFLYTQLCESLEPLRFEVCRPDSHMNKAVADGGVLYVIDHHVTARVARFTYGTIGSRVYQNGNKEHRSRNNKTHGTQVTETQEFIQALSEFYEESDDYESYSIYAPIQVYRGQVERPQWTDKLKPRRRPDGKTFYQFDFKVILLFGLTELRAQLKWFENVSQLLSRFPAQEHAGGDSKIPSVLFYDRYGQVRAVGAETLQEDVILRASDERWVRSEWFKLHLRPRASDPSQELSTLPPLPPNKTVVDVFADMLAYLIDCAKVYIRETHPGGANLWSSVGQNVDFVLTHPNGWEGRQQALMRLAAVQAKLIPDTDAGKARVTFVSEGEASLHFCLNKGLIAEGAMSNKGIIIVDAGGGTIDLSAYKQTKTGDKTSYAECAAAQCLFKGSIMVKRSAHTYVKGKPQRATDIVDTFDRTTKLTFKNAKTPSYVKFGGMNDNDPAYSIRGGRLVIAGTDMAKFFQPSVTSITQAVHRQRGEASLSGPLVFLVGGFAASGYLYTELQANLAPLGMDVFRPDNHTNKAVAEGGVLYVLDHRVSARVARFTYGICGHERYAQANPEHARRYHKSYVGADGDRFVKDHFFSILEAGTLVTETQEFKSSFVRNYFSPVEVSSSQDTDIWVYRGDSKNPQWTDVDADDYTKICTVPADASNAARNLSPLYNRHGSVYYKFSFDVILLFGLTELKAQISWLEHVRCFTPPSSTVADYLTIRYRVSNNGESYPPASCVA